MPAAIIWSSRDTSTPSLLLESVFQGPLYVEMRSSAPATHTRMKFDRAEAGVQRTSGDGMRRRPRNLPKALVMPQLDLQGRNRPRCLPPTHPGLKDRCET